MDKRKQVDAAIARYMDTNPNTDNICPSYQKPKPLKNSHKRVTARPKFSTRFGRGGGFKSGKGKFS